VKQTTPHSGHVLAYAARLGWGLALLSRPGTMLTMFRASDDERARITLRILGARHVLQSALCGPRPGRVVAGVAAAVDIAHALSAIGFAALDRDRRGIAVADAAVAAGWTAIDAHIIRHS
jgi:hypothetical protein